MIIASIESTRALPLHLMTSAEKLPRPRWSQTQRVHAAFQKKRVAIVEDELLIAWALEALLEDAGHEVIGIFCSGELALAGLADQEVDVVCMDINLGNGIDGIQTASQLRAKIAREIIFITAYADAATAKRAREVVPDAILLGKPVSPDALQDALRRSGFPTS